MESRSVIEGAFDVLSGLRHLGEARVSELQRHTGLPRTTVTRLLAQLQGVDAVERCGSRWRLGRSVLGLDALVPTTQRLSWTAHRPLAQLACATRQIVGLSLRIDDRDLVVDVIPGLHPLHVPLKLGETFRRSALVPPSVDVDQMAATRAHRAALDGDMRPVLDIGAADPRLSCIAVPLRVSSSQVGAVWTVAPRGRETSVPDAAIRAVGAAARTIASEVSPGS